MLPKSLILDTIYMKLFMKYSDNVTRYWQMSQSVLINDVLIVLMTLPLCLKLLPISDALYLRDATMIMNSISNTSLIVINVY